MYCQDCKFKECLGTDKPCKRVRSYLRKNKIYDADFIRPQKEKGIWREIPISQIESEGLRNHINNLTYGEIGEEL